MKGQRKTRLLACLLGIILVFLNTFQTNEHVLKVHGEENKNAFRFTDQSNENNESKAFQLGTVKYKIGNGGWSTVSTSSNITISSDDTIYFQLLPNTGYKIDMNRNVNIACDGNRSQMGQDTDDNNGTVTGTAEGKYYKFTPAKRSNSDDYSFYEIEFGFEAESQTPQGQGGGQGGSNSSLDISGNQESNNIYTFKYKVNAGEWKTYSHSENLELQKNDQLSVRVDFVDDGQVHTISSVNAHYEDKQNSQSRFDYFYSSNNSNPPNDIADKLVSSDGYTFTFKPEDDSKDADGNIGLLTNAALFRIRIDTMTAATSNQVEIFIYTQIKYNDTDGYGVYEDSGNPENTTFIDSAIAKEVIFSFNGNEYGDQGDPFGLGYGRQNNGSEKHQITYTSLYKENKNNTTTQYPVSYDYFKVYGYNSSDYAADSTRKNVIRFENDLIDKLYVITGDDNYTFGSEVSPQTSNGRTYYEVDVPASNKIRILIREHDDPNVVLSWDYQNANSDQYVDHGRVYIEQVKRGGTVILGNISKDSQGNILVSGNGEVSYGISSLTGRPLSCNNSGGDFELMKGDQITIKLIPTYGYQIERAELNGMTLSPQSEVSTFTFTINGHLHLAGTFVEVSDTIDANSALVSGASISAGENAADSGNLKLSINDNAAYTTDVTEAVSGQNVTQVASVDLSLDNIVSKGDGNYWENSVTSFSNPIQISLNVPKSPEGKGYSIVREHNGTLQELEATYDRKNGKLVFPTNQFSTYTIVLKDGNFYDEPEVTPEMEEKAEEETTTEPVNVETDKTESVFTATVLENTSFAEPVLLDMAKSKESVIPTTFVEKIASSENATVSLKLADNIILGMNSSTVKGVVAAPIMVKTASANEVKAFMANTDNIPAGAKMIVMTPLAGATVENKVVLYQYYGPEKAGQIVYFYVADATGKFNVLMSSVIFPNGFSAFLIPAVGFIGYAQQ